MYHILSLLDLRILRDSGSFSGATQALLKETAQASEAAVTAIVHPDGEVALFNDSWLGEGPPAVEAVPNLQVRPADPMRWVLPAAGYVRLAQGGDSVVMDFGPCGPDDNPGHAHADFLSLELSVDGKRLLVDTGTPTYSQGEVRNTLRSAASHNGPIRDGLEPIEFWGSFRVGHRGYAHALPIEGAMRFAAWHDGYIGHGTAVARAIELFPGRGLLVCDLWAGAPVGTAKTHFLLAGDWRLSDRSAIAPNGTQVNFAAINGTLSEFMPAHHWLRFGEALPANRVTLLPGPGANSGLQAASLWISWGNISDLATEEERGLSEQLVAAFTSDPKIKGLI